MFNIKKLRHGSFFIIVYCILLFLVISNTAFADVYNTDIVSYAGQFLGYPYGQSYGPNSFDCIGLVKYVFGHFGIDIPWSSWTVWNYYSNYGTEVSEANALPGDVVIWSGHAGIYVGNGQMINALNPDYGVCYTNVTSYCSDGYKDDAGKFHCTKLNPPHKFIRIYGVNYGEKNGVLDVNGLLDGNNIGGLSNYGTVDVYITKPGQAETKVGEDVADYVQKLPSGTTYRIDDIKAKNGYSYDGLSSGSLTGTISANITTDVRLIFNSCILDVKGSLDGEISDTLGTFATFDVVINGFTVADDVNDYNARATKNSTYEITDIKSENGYEYTGTVSGSLTGTISSGTKSVTLGFSFDSTPNMEWKVTKTLPSGVTTDTCEIQYSSQISQEAVSSPGDGWINTGIARTVYENDGDPYESDIELTTSETRELVSYYYYHFCSGSTGVNADHTIRNGYVHYDSISDPSTVTIVSGYPHQDDTDTEYKYYKLNWKTGGEAKCKSGVTCDGSFGTHGERSYYWYRMSTYQNKKAVTYYKWEKTTGWQDTPVSGTTPLAVRYRLKFDPTLTISQGNVLGYANGIEVKTAYDKNATGYKITVYDVANQKTITPTIDTPVKSGNNVTINIHGSSLVNGNIYRLKVYKYNTTNGTTVNSNTVTVYGMPHSAISKVTAQPIGTGVRLDSEFKAGTNGTRYYVYDAATGAQVKKLNLTGPASHLKITGLENNKLYYAYARPYKIYNNQYLLGPKSKLVYFAPVAMPSGVTVAFSDATTAVISTAANTTARGVRVLYREVGGSLKNGCVQAGNQCSIPNLSQAKSYEFYVMHYNIINNVRHYGSGITIQYNAPTVSTLPRPTGIRVNAGNPTWTFTITKDAEAAGISVLYRINEGNFALACEKDGASCTMDLTKDKAYTFFIMQYKVVNGKKVYSPGATVKNLYGTKSAEDEIPEDAFVEVDETFDTDQLYTILEDYLTEEDLNALEAMELAALEGEAGFAEAADIEPYEEEDLYDLVPGALVVMEDADIPEPTEDDFIYVPAMQSAVSGKAAGLSKLTIAQNAVLGYSNGIEVTTAYDDNATGYSVAVYDVANQKTVKPSIQTTDKSGKTVINISGSTLVNGNIYRLMIFKMSSEGEKSNTVTVYGMPHTVIGSVTAQPIGTGVRLDSVFKTGTNGTRYYVNEAATGKRVKVENLTGPASHLKITGLENNKLYYAYARPYKIYNNQYLLGPQSKLVYFAPVAMPSGVSVQYSDLTTAVISVNENDTARGIRVLYREVGGSLKNGCVKADIECPITNLSQSKSYEFYVMHYNIIDGVRHYGSGITIRTNVPTLSTLPRPTGIKIYAGNPTWTFSITKDSAAKGISVLYRINEGNFALACEKDGASCTKDLTKDQAYTFFIMQYKLVNGKKVYSDGATVKNLYGTKTIDGNDLVTEFVEAEESITSDELYDVLEDYLTPNDMTGLEAMDVLSMEEPEAFEADPELDVFEEEYLDDDVVPAEFRTMEVMDDYEPTEADFIDVPMEGALSETAPKVWDGSEEQISYDESDDTQGLNFYGIDDGSYSYEPPAPSFQNK